MQLKATRLRERMKGVSDERIASHFKNWSRMTLVVIAVVEVDCGTDPPLR